METTVDFSDINAVKDRIKEIQVELAGHAIPRNKWYRNSPDIPVDISERRRILIPELLGLENRLRQLNTHEKNKRVNSHDTVWKENMYELLIEIFGKDEFRKLTSECINRSKGLEPQKVVLNYGFNQQDKESIKKISKQSAELKEMLLSARKHIDRYIRQNEPEVNKADYHAKVKELISCMPPEKEIYKIKTTP